MIINFTEKYDFGEWFLGELKRLAKETEDGIVKSKRGYREFRVGDTVRVRSWDDMVSEFGLTAGGLVAVKNGFVDQMRQMSGNKYVVKQTDPRIKMEPLFGSSPEQGIWTIDQDMLTLITAAPERKRMTQGDIERELGYEIDIVEVED